MRAIRTEQGMERFYRFLKRAKCVRHACQGVINYGVAFKQKSRLMLTHQTTKADNRFHTLFSAPIIHNERGFCNMCTYFAFGAFGFALGAIFPTVGMLADRKGVRR